MRRWLVGAVGGGILLVHLGWGVDSIDVGPVGTGRLQQLLSECHRGIWVMYPAGSVSPESILRSIKPQVTGKVLLTTRSSPAWKAVGGAVLEKRVAPVPQSEEVRTGMIVVVDYTKAALVFPEPDGTVRVAVTKDWLVKELVDRFLEQWRQSKERS